MRYIGIALLVIVMVFGFTAVAQAARGMPGGPGQPGGFGQHGGPGLPGGPGQPGAPGENRPPMVASITGQVTALSGNTFTIQGTAYGRPKLLVLTINSATKIGSSEHGTTGRGRSSHMTAAPAADLQLGDTVKVFYDVADDVALAIIITSASAPTVAPT